MNAIEVKNLEKSYGNFRALKGINFSVSRGEIFGFLGPNGAGKTTTIKIITTMLPPDSGETYVLGHSIVDESKEVRRKIGVLPEAFGFYEEMSALSYLAFNGSFYRKDERRCKEMLKLVGLEKVADRKISTFSHGMRQKLGLALAMLNDPEVLVLDEPTNGLDPKAIFEFEEIIKGLKDEGKTIFLSSHILPEVQKLCDRVCIINEGSVVSVDSVSNLSKEVSALRARIGLLEPLPGEVLKTIEGISGVKKLKSEDSMIEVEVENYEILAGINEKLVRSGAKVFEIRTMEASLEDVFLKLTGVKK
ncbi:MAG: ABC transporter ATP-binding protein [Candidatus Thermoplasmatota archaeon]|nr:ABC transporter ATP-binding protein [Candidatus Thermoplasmatota archaeon]